MQDLSGVVLSKIMEQSMDYDKLELLGLVTFSLNAVSVGISYIVYNFLIHLINAPDIQHKVRSEIEKVYKESGEWNKEVFEKLDYTMLCIKETLRLGAPFTFMPELELK